MANGRHTPGAKRPVDPVSPCGESPSHSPRPAKRPRPISPEPFTGRPPAASYLKWLLVVVAVVSVLYLLRIAWFIWEFDYDLGHPHENGFSDWQR